MKHRHLIETAGLQTAGSVTAYTDPAGGVRLYWPRADLSMTAPDAADDYNGPAGLSLRLTPDEAHDLVSRILVAMAEVGSEAS